MNLIKLYLEKPVSARNYYEVATNTTEDESVRVNHIAQVDDMSQEVDDLLHNDLPQDIWIYASVTKCQWDPY